MASPGGLKRLWLNVPGTRIPGVDDFLAHPEFRQIATFSLGGVFVISLKYILSSVLFKTVFGRANRSRRHRQTESSAPEVPLDSSSDKSGSKRRISANLVQCILIFTLSLCFALASLADLFSLLIFHPDRGGICAFVVAWGGMTSQIARLIGIIILMLELERLGVRLREKVLQVLAVLIGAGLIFTSNAISFGVAVQVAQLNRIICHRRYFLVTSLITSSFYILLELVITLRLLSFIAPSFLSFRHRLMALRDVRVIRGLSLLFLDLLTIVPGAVWVNILAAFIPFCVGALAVLVAFNHHPEVIIERSGNSIPPLKSDPLSREQTVRVAPLPISRPRTSSLVPPRTRIFDRKDIAVPAATQSQAIDDRQTRSTRSRRFPTRTLTARSDLSMDSVTAKSIKNAVVSVAKYAKLSPISASTMGETPTNRVGSTATSVLAADPVPTVPTLPLPEPKTMEPPDSARSRSAPRISLELGVDVAWNSQSARTSVTDISGFEIIQLYGNRMVTDSSLKAPQQLRVSGQSPTESTPRPFAPRLSLDSTREEAALASSADESTPKPTMVAQVADVRDFAADNGTTSVTQNETNVAIAGEPNDGVPERASLALTRTGLPSNPRLRPGQWVPSYKGSIGGPRPPPRTVLPPATVLESPLEGGRL